MPERMQSISITIPSQEVGVVVSRTVDRHQFFGMPRLGDLLAHRVRDNDVLPTMKDEQRYRQLSGTTEVVEFEAKQRAGNEWVMFGRHITPGRKRRVEC